MEHLPSAPEKQIYGQGRTDLEKLRMRVNDSKAVKEWLLEVDPKNKHHKYITINSWGGKALFISRILADFVTKQAPLLGIHRDFDVRYDLSHWVKTAREKSVTYTPYNGGKS